MKKKTANIGVVEQFGRFEKVAEPGLRIFIPFLGQYLAGILSNRISSLDVRIETKTKSQSNQSFWKFSTWKNSRWPRRETRRHQLAGKRRLDAQAFPRH